MSEETDKNKSISLYEVLNVNRDATKEEIRKGYKKMSLLYHPGRTKNQSINHQIIIYLINHLMKFFFFKKPYIILLFSIQIPTNRQKSKRN